MEKVILIRFNEIHLKGGNKKYFLNLLYSNIKEAIKNVPCKLENIQNRLVLRDYDNSYEQDIIDALTAVFGVHSISIAVELNSDVDEVKNYVSTIKINKSFKCDVNRADKSFPIKSNDFAADLGEIVLKNNSMAHVDIHNPDITISVDIRENGKTFVFTDTIHSYSGLPLGEKADGLLLLSGGIDSPVAGFCMAKRGLRQDILHFDSFPYTSPQAKEKVITLAKKIKKFIGAKYMYICSMTKLQEEFHIHCNSEYAINLLRRSMIRVANYLCEKHNYKTIVTGESLGQVASQTIESLNSTNSVAKYIVLRPLISFNKEEIIEIAKKIGTYETSILPYEDCCTVFLPRNPIIKPRIKDSEREETKINLNNILASILDSIEVIELDNV
ncbi:MAG TPA: tRNA 4-thiouridine(8) synthase ThiI [Candidatus Onthoplasma faecipullorum]|nr:tRNA 4-thiouridine(8) synthase ThiI [Candidatus Onthoplasma faecipullorum]